MSLVILDFDGTFTDVERESAPFLEAFVADVVDLLGDEDQSRWDRLHAEAMANRGKHGWRHHGVITAPAGADPYLTASCVAQLMFDDAGILKDEETRSAILQALYQKNYALSASAPRPEAVHVMQTLLASEHDVVVVTNSHTQTVKDKIAGLSIPGAERLEVIGDAKKFVIDDAPRGEPFDSLEDLALPGLDERKVAIKRGHYFDVLKRLWAERGQSAETTLICGDIFELDLALPLALGCRGHLVRSSMTPPYEVTYLEAHPLATVSDTLAGVLEQV